MEEELLSPMKIELLDNLVKEPLIAEIYESLSGAGYRFGERSTHDDPFSFWIALINQEVLNSVQPVRALWGLVQKHITKDEFGIYRMYVNANNFGDCTSVHTDCPAAAEGFYTVLYYANPNWEANWAGETVFYNDAKDEIIRSVYPRPGRFVCFDSRIPHVARPPTRICSILRYTIAIKLKKK